MYAEFVLHKGIRIHTDGFMTMETGGAYINSNKHNIEINISIEANLVVVDDVLTRVICNQYFLKYQGYKIHGNIIYRDNQSAIKLDNNGSRSSIKITRHIIIRCYFITDKITKQEASVEFCTAPDTIGAYFTKALQVYPLCTFGNIIIGIHKDDIPSYNVYGGDLLEKLKI